MSSTAAAILHHAVDGNRLSFDEGVELFRSAPLLELGRAADLVCRRLHPGPFRTYNIDRNINYTNVCTAVCDFCAFYRKVDETDAYVLDRAVLLEKIRETVALGGDQILMQGGLHPHLKLEWYEELLQDIKSHFPGVNVHGFSAPEIHHFTKVSKRPLKEVLVRLKAAGLGSLPGGGAEILVDRVRTDDDPRQGDDGRLARSASRLARAWWSIDGDDDVRSHRDARRARRTFRAGAPASGRNRRLHGFHLLDVSARPYRHGRHPGRRFIRVLEEPGDFPALRRQHREHPILLGDAGTQNRPDRAFFGANDMGSLMIEENVVSSAGTVYHLSLEEIKSAITEAGYVPRQRNVFYDFIDAEPASNLVEAVAT